LKKISNWKKPVLIIVIFSIIIILTNFILIFFFGSIIKSNLEWLLGNENKTIFSNLLFIEGAFTIGIGALLASGYAENRMQQHRGPATPYVVDKLSKQRPEFREKQKSTALLLILAGLPLISIAIISSFFRKFKLK